jgi:hypothetical protein
MMILIDLLGIGILMLACHLSYWRGRKAGYWKGYQEAWTLARRAVGAANLTPKQSDEMRAALMVEQAIGSSPVPRPLGPS